MTYTGNSTPDSDEYLCPWGSRGLPFMTHGEFFDYLSNMWASQGCVSYVFPDGVREYVTERAVRSLHFSLMADALREDGDGA